MMSIERNQIEHGLSVVKLSGSLVRTRALRDLTRQVEQLRAEGCRGILFDLSRIKRVNMTGLASLIELVARNPKTDFGFCEVPPKTMSFLHKSGLDRGLHFFASLEEAQKNPHFQSHMLSGVRVVLLCAGKGSRVAPLTDLTPKPLLDMAGRPTMHRIIDHLGQFGLHDILLNPGHLGHQIIDYFRSAPTPDARITFVNEGQWSESQWQSAPIGSASTLRRIQDRNAAFHDDVVVLCADALIDLDMAEMMQAHRRSGAAATIAALTVPETETHKYGIIEANPDQMVTRFIEKPAQGETSSQLANSGIYIFKPEVFDLIGEAEGLDIACDLLPAIMAGGQKIHVYDKPFSWVDIGCGRDYAVAVRKCLAGEIPSAEPVGQEIRPNVWAMPDAKVSRRAEISGPCHIGAGARIEAGAKLSGTCSVGAGAVIEGRTHLRNSMVMPDTWVKAGALADSMILHATWAVNHRFADGSAQNCAAYEHVEALDTGVPLTIRKSA